MDMNSAFVIAAKQVMPFAEKKIVHDPFRLMKMANQSLDTVRMRRSF
jgi:transposase